MPTVTPFPTLTPFPTPAGTPVVNLAPAMDIVAPDSLGPQVVQWWQTAIGPFWPQLSGAILLVLMFVFMFWVLGAARDEQI